MKTTIKKATTIAIAAAALTTTTATLTACNESQRENPLLAESTLPFGAPDFSKIETKDYMPAFEAAIEQKRQEIAAITGNTDSATFENTIVALEESGKLLTRVSNVFYALVEADKTPEIAEIEKKVTPMLTELENEVSFDQKLFERIKQVYDCDHDTLQGEDQKLLEETYKDFVRRGALLPEEKMARMKEINLRIADLQLKWGEVLPDATNDAVVWIDSKDELSGLSEADIAQCAKDAESRGKKAPYAIVIVNTTQQPLLTSLDNRDVRRRVYEASIHRSDGTGKYNTFPIVVEIAKLRAEQAQLMGYPNYAAYSLEKTMAKTPDNVYAFLKSLIGSYRPKADAETKAIEEYARKTAGADFELQPYDRFYYSAKMRKELLDISDDEVKPYFNVDSVLKNGVFYAANRAYGLTFNERTDIPTYHPDMKVFEVIDKDGQSKALFYCDYYRRPTKRGGAWMDGFAKQSNLRGQKPMIYNVCNNAKAPDGQPSLLTWDEVTTMFHEFGHALHGILSDCKYNSLSGTAVARDFVEMPSQFNESFASIPEVFDNFARHYETGEPIHPCTTTLCRATIIIAIEARLLLAVLVEDLEDFHVGMIGRDVGTLLESKTIGAVGRIEHAIDQNTVDGEIRLDLIVTDVEHLVLHLCRIVETIVGLQMEVRTFGLAGKVLNGLGLSIGFGLVLGNEALQESIDIFRCLGHGLLQRIGGIVWIPHEFGLFGSKLGNLADKRVGIDLACAV